MDFTEICQFITNAPKLISNFAVIQENISNVKLKFDSVDMKQIEAEVAQLFLDHKKNFSNNNQSQDYLVFRVPTIPKIIEEYFKDSFEKIKQQKKCKIQEIRNCMIGRIKKSDLFLETQSRRMTFEDIPGNIMCQLIQKSSMIQKYSTYGVKNQNIEFAIQFNKAKSKYFFPSNKEEEAFSTFTDILEQSEKNEKDLLEGESLIDRVSQLNSFLDSQFQSELDYLQINEQEKNEENSANLIFSFHIS